MSAVRTSFVDERPPSEMQKDVLERRAPHERALRLHAELVDALGGAVAVVCVEEEPAAQRLDAAREAVDEHVLAQRQLHVERVLLRHDAEPRTYRGTVFDRIEAEDRDRAARRR